MRRTFARLAPVAIVVVIVGCASTSPPTKEPTEAAKIDPEYDRLCAGIAPEQQAKCPVGAWTQSADDVEGGVLLHLNASAPPPEETQKRMRCHRAWMAHDPSNAMPRCPIGSPGITITSTVGGAGTDLSLIASTPDDAQEVRKRAHAALGK
jgi:hypothetical protein